MLFSISDELLDLRRLLAQTVASLAPILTRLVALDGLLADGLRETRMDLRGWRPCRGKCMALHRW